MYIHILTDMSISFPCSLVLPCSIKNVIHSTDIDICHVTLKDSLSYRGAHTSLKSHSQPRSGDGELGRGKES